MTDQFEQIDSQESQLKLDVKTSNQKQLLELWKYKINKIEKTFETVPFWRSGINVLTIVTLIFSAVASFSLVVIFWNQLPIQIPWFYLHTKSSWGEFSPIYLYVSVFFLVILSTAIFRLSQNLYTKDRRLSNVMNIISIVSNLLFLIALGEILSLMVI